MKKYKNVCPSEIKLSGFNSSKNIWGIGEEVVWANFLEIFEDIVVGWIASITNFVVGLEYIIII